MAKPRQRRSESQHLISPTFSRFLRHRMMEIMGGILILISLGLLVSLLTYNPNDPSFHHATGANAQNGFGFWGASIANYLYEWIGFASFFLVAVFAVYGIRYLRNIGLRSPFKWRIALVPFCLMGWAYIFRWMLQESEEFPNGYGGAIGYLSHEKVVEIFAESSNLLYFSLGVLVVVSFLSGRALIFSLKDWKAILLFIPLTLVAIGAKIRYKRPEISKTKEHLKEEPQFQMQPQKLQQRSRQRDPYFHDDIHHDIQPVERPKPQIIMPKMTAAERTKLRQRKQQEQLKKEQQSVMEHNPFAHSSVIEKTMEEPPFYREEPQVYREEPQAYKDEPQEIYNEPVQPAQVEEDIFPTRTFQEKERPVVSSPYKKVRSTTAESFADIVRRKAMQRKKIQEAQWEEEDFNPYDLEEAPSFHGDKEDEDQFLKEEKFPSREQYIVEEEAFVAPWDESDVQEPDEELWDSYEDEEETPILKQEEPFL